MYTVSKSIPFFKGFCNELGLKHVYNNLKSIFYTRINYNLFIVDDILLFPLCIFIICHIQCI